MIDDRNILKHLIAVFIFVLIQRRDQRFSAIDNNWIFSEDSREDFKKHQVPSNQRLTWKKEAIRWFVFTNIVSRCYGGCAVCRRGLYSRKS